jgi:ABC-type multidrug transport system ATPase subunit
MTLLELERVSKRFALGTRMALDDVSLSIDAGEMVVVLGERRSGRSTLLRIAAGVEVPDSGVVRFAGSDLVGWRDGGLGEGIGYCRKRFRPTAGGLVIDQLIAGQLGRKVPRDLAYARAIKALDRVGGEDYAGLRVREMNAEETARVSIARALSSGPRVLVIDEPALGLDPAFERDGVLELLRSLADEGISILASAGDGTGLLGADRVISLGDGVLRGELRPELTPVESLDERRQSRR